MSLFSALTDGSVWAQGSSLFNISSPLNDLLEKEDFTLEQVLQEDELVQEVKTRNTKLLDFLSQDEIVQKLIEYVVRTPENMSDDLRTLKYPYMSCEVICCDISTITETLVTASDGKIIETLFEFLYQTEPLDPRLAGYFEKIVTMLMVRKPHEMTTLMNKHSEQLLMGFARHTASFSIAELLKRLLQPYQADYMDDCMDFPGMAMTFPPSNSWYGTDEDDGMSGSVTPTGSKEKILTWQVEPTIVDLLLTTLADETSDSDAHKHAAEVLVDIIHCGSRAHQSDPVSPASSNAPASLALLEHLETKEVAEKLITLAVPNDEKASCISSMTAAISVLSALLLRATNAQYCATDEMPPVVACVVSRVPQICTILKTNAADAGTVRNQRHQEVPRLGLRRLKMVGLIVSLMQSKYQTVDVALLENDVISICLDLFFQFESVNMLHADVESMVIGILESGSHDLLIGLVKDARLLPRIIEAHEKNDEATAVAKGFSFGYVGHLHRICNMLMTMLEDVRGSTNEEGSLNDMRHADTVLELFEEDDVTWKKWDDLSSKVLAPLYERERLPLGGVTIPQTSEDPYLVMGFNQNDELLNAQFAEMLGASGFDADVNGFNGDFDGKDTDTPMLPEIMNDSSSSDEDEDEVSRQESTDTGTDDGAASDRWASFESGGSWAKFETTFEEIPFEPIPGMEKDDFDDEEIVPAIVTTADLAVSRAAKAAQVGKATEPLEVTTETTEAKTNAEMKVEDETKCEVLDSTTNSDETLGIETTVDESGNESAALETQVEAQ
ncbi:SAP family cell cycle dependent phosphatase-associated protein [Plasmopara halstedii]|uniref:SAP family cell cycle dependent phosphatase-associated protein n=1 Tax=Plasmopara halstedii TaxID=4781 RepID=A0A0P1AJ82_PLAHL|nr:SAP family cell cycle dependent phosphatase-associated protein [Plasmopara halstedii]CEG40589.1 SAP family cell cycle dependent phosphatase-associated protein [Plasmopara halstedii]|eukprot:XP_024576958.1 SAP family cell cycle dependent phosphatase-associated protein [Plasmopara halstedii]